MVYPAQTLDGELGTRCPDMARWCRDNVAPVTTRDTEQGAGAGAGAGARLRRLEESRDQVPRAEVTRTVTTVPRCAA